MSRPIRVLLCKLGLDGHDRGVQVVAQGLRDAGMEVIYTGLRQSVESVIHAALDEDVDVIGVSSLSGAHMTVFPRLKEACEKEGLQDMVLIGGGIIPDEDVASLQAIGFAAVFTPGTEIKEVVAVIHQQLGRAC